MVINVLKEGIVGKKQNKQSYSQQTNVAKLIVRFGSTNGDLHSNKSR